MSEQPTYQFTQIASMDVIKATDTEDSHDCRDCTGQCEHRTGHVA